MVIIVHPVATALMLMGNSPLSATGPLDFGEATDGPFVTRPPLELAPLSTDCQCVGDEAGSADTISPPRLTPWEEWR